MRAARPRERQFRWHAHCSDKWQLKCGQTEGGRGHERSWGAVGDSGHDAGTKTVTLKGTVPTATQRAAAEKVAREKAEGYKVRNLLTVVKK